ncbi:MAG: 4-hydroxy-tetrahydrodipicolinate synthase [Thermoguttaceae bacterium]
MAAGFRGVFPAMLTPMTPAEDVDYTRLEALAEYLIGAGVHGLIPLGSTGEFYALSPQERHDVLKTVIRAVGGRVPVVAGVNAGATRDVVQYSREAEALGAAGVLVAPPYYSLPRPDEVLEHIRLVDRAIGIPIMLYNFPGRTGVDMKPEFLERLAELKNVRYVKESTGETARISEIIRRCGERLRVFCGCDSVVLESFVLGAVGWVAAVANVCAAEHVRLYELLERQDFVAAREYFFRLEPLLSFLEYSGKFTQLVKAGAGLAGRDAGPPRRPLLPPIEEEMEPLRAALAAIR